MSQTLLECHQLSCERDGRVLFEGLDISFKSGDVVQIEGPNGSGKTTMLRALVGLFADYQGEISWSGTNIHQSRTDFLSNLLFIGHLAGVKKSLSPRENLLFHSSLHQSIDLSSIDEALAKVGLYGYEDLPGYQLSAGQLRRVGLARLYLSNAPLWVLDEPFTAIDKQGVKALENLFLKHAKSGGCVILTTHQTPEITGLKQINLLDYLPKVTESFSEGEFND